MASEAVEWADLSKGVVVGGYIKAVVTLKRK